MLCDEMYSESRYSTLSVGIRACCKEEIETRQQHNVCYQDADTFAPKQIHDIQLSNGFPKHSFYR